jgi:thioredoxin 1
LHPWTPINSSGDGNLISIAGVDPDVATTELTDANFTAETSQRTVVIDFWAEWCGPCRQFAPVFSRVAGDYDDVVFGKVDVDGNPGLAQAFAVTAIPTLVVLRDDKVLVSQAGAMNESALRATIDKALRGPKRMTFSF